MVFPALNFIYHIYFPWLILWSKPQISMGLTYHTLWLYYYDVHVVFSDLSLEEELGIRSFSHPYPFLFLGYSFTDTGNYSNDIPQDFQILTVLSISITLNRFDVETVFPPLILLGGWPPPKTHSSVFLAYPLPFPLVWSSGSIYGTIIGLATGTGSTLWDPGLSLDFISDFFLLRPHSMNQILSLDYRCTILPPYKINDSGQMWQLP